MPKLTGLKMKERGKELAPIRARVFELCNRGITSPKAISMRLVGLDVNYNTIAGWIRKWKRGKGLKKITNRMPSKQNQLKKARFTTYEIWEKNPEINVAELGIELRNLGFRVKNNTRRTWLKRFNSGAIPKGYKIKQATPIARITTQPVAEVGLDKPTWEQIVEACPDTETLGLILVNGFITIAKERDELRLNVVPDLKFAREEIAELIRKISEITQERDRIIKIHNEQVAKKRIGHLTIDQVQHRLIPKG